MKTTILVSMLTFVSVNTYAGPLLKSYSHTPKPSFSIGLDNMSPSSLRTWQEFFLDTRRISSGKGYGEMASSELGLLIQQGDRSVVHKMERNLVTGDLTKSAFELPPTDLKPKTVAINSSPGGTLVVRHFETPSGFVEVHQNFKVEKLAGKDVRVQSDFALTSDAMRGYVQIRGDSYMVYTQARQSSVNGLADFPRASFDGNVLGFNLSSNGSRVTFHIQKGDKFVEEVYSLTPTKPESAAQQVLSQKKVSTRILTSQEVKNLGLLAEQKVIAGRKASAKPAGGMKVDDSVGEAASSSSGMQ